MEKAQFFEKITEKYVRPLKEVKETKEGKFFVTTFNNTCYIIGKDQLLIDCKIKKKTFLSLWERKN